MIDLIPHLLISQSLLAVSIMDAKVWYAVPMILSISLVYGSTRHERVPEILRHAIRSAVWILCFMGIIFAMIMISDMFL